MTNHPLDMVHVIKFCPYHDGVEMSRDDEGGEVLEWCEVCDMEARDLAMENMTHD